MLLPYQEVGASYLARNKKAILGDDMGLGKSAQTVSACDTVAADTVVVVCPASVREVWRREFAKFSIFTPRVEVILGSGDASLIKPGQVNVLSFEACHKPDIHRAVLALPGFVLIIDEAHFLKNRKTKRTKSVYGDKCDGKTGFASKATHIFPLSGTIMPNHPGDVWTHLKALGAIRSDYWAFVDTYCTGYDNGREYKITGGKNFDQLRRLLDGVMLRRTKSQVQKELPAIFYHDLPLPISASELKALRTHSLGVEPGNETDIEKALARPQNFSVLRRKTGLAKVAPSVDIVDVWFESGLKKLVVFAIHRDVIDALQSAFKARGYCPVVIAGDTPAQQRQQAVDRFQTDESVRVFIGQVQAAGTGITLTAASTVLFVETSWVPAENAQAAKRCDRIGQKETVDVYFGSIPGTIDETVQRVLRRKSTTIGKALSMDKEIFV